MQFKCSVCGYVYDPAEGDPAQEERAAGRLRGELLGVSRCDLFHVQITPPPFANAERPERVHRLLAVEVAAEIPERNGIAARAGNAIEHGA